jgi:predicted secreted Zn-dependent protease
MTIEPQALAWQRSDFCGNGACVEVASAATGVILVRDSKDPDGPKLRFTRAEWDAFVAGIKADYFVLD